MLKNLRLKKEDILKIHNYCSKKNIKFLSTAFDPESLDFLLSLGQDYIKIPSGEITNGHLLSHINKKEKSFVINGCFIY